MQTENFHGKAEGIAKRLLSGLGTDISRPAFFKVLAEELSAVFKFDRLVINLYDSDGGMLSYFTSAEGAVVSSLSPVRPADASNTVAGRAIAGRKPVIITDLARCFPEAVPHPLMEAGLTTTMAFPLMLNNRVFATLHCSFLKQPSELYAITNFLTELCPAIAVCLGAILSFSLSAPPLSRRIEEKQQGRKSGRRSAGPEPDAAFVYQSPAMRTLMRRVDAMARLNVPILILGESGTGKTMLAREIHLHSPRRDSPFVKVSCPSLSSTLFESELFGHCKGAFTGAAAKRVGRVEMAHGGTLFLDEIGELGADMQSKLLQVLDESTFERVGESIPLTVDVRFVAATNMNVAAAVAGGRFRGDLFHRLAVCVLEMPPLRGRREDIPLLIRVISRQLAARYALPPLPAAALRSAEMMKLFTSWEWPGNIRELRGLLLRMMTMYSVTGRIGMEETRALLEENAALEISAGKEAEERRPAPAELTSLADMEREHILRALEKTGGRLGGVSGAAALLGLNRSTLQHRMRKLGIGGRKRVQP